MGDPVTFNLDIKGFKFIKSVIGDKIGFIPGSFLIFFIMPFILLTISSFFEGVLFLPGNNVGYFEDFPIIGIMLLFSVLVIFSNIFFQKYSMLPKKLSVLIDTNQFSREEYANLIGKINRIVEGKGKWFALKILFHLLCLAGALYVSLSFAHFNILFPWDTWRFSHYPYNFIIFTGYQLIIGGYFIPAIFWRLITSVFSLNLLFKKLKQRNAIILPLLSHDRTGGLKIVGELAFLFYLILFLPLVHIIFSIYYWSINNGEIIWGEGTIGLLVYFPIILILFFLPVYQAHNVMKEAKRNERKKILDQYKKLIIQKEESSSRKDTSNIEELVNLFSLEERIEKMPEWPFNLFIIRSVVGSVVVPIVLISLQEFLF